MAQAQEEKSSALEEIVVTAERRAESLQDVPLSITAFSDERRDIVGINSIQDMANFAPGFSFNMNTDRPSIRGIARQSNFFSLDSPVANYFDGVYTSSVQDAQRRPIFIERTEILRGPQGALSGRGSIAGAVNTISKRPKDEFGGEVRAFGGSYSRYGLEGTVTSPLTDWWRFRVNLGTYHQNEGYFENVASGDTEGDQPNNRNVQDYLMEFDIGESIDVFLKASFADYDESRRTGYSTAPYVAGVQNNPTAFGPSSGTLTPLASFGYFPAAQATRLGTGITQNPVITTGDVHKFSNDFHSRQKLDDHHNFNAHVTWHAPSVDLKWIGGHQNYRYTQWTDVDTTDVLSMRLPVNAAFPQGRNVSPGGTNMYMEERKWWSNELTATSTGEGPFSWIGGLYQSTEHYIQEPATTIYPGYPELNRPWGTVAELLPVIAWATTLPITTLPPLPTTPRPPANQVAGRSVFGELAGETVSSAAFGQLDYNLTDQWKVTLGLRYNKDEKEVRERLRYIANGLGNGLGGVLAGGALSAVLGGPISVDVTPLPTAGAALPRGVTSDRLDAATGYRMRTLEGEWTAVTGSIGVDYKPREQDLLYLRVAKGYRPGGFNAGFLYDPPLADEENVISYEVGFKTTLWDRLQLGTSVFYYDYTDIQLPLPTLGRCTDPNDLSTCTTLNSFVNLPTAESMGIEIEANWNVTDDLNLYLSYGYLDAKIKDAMAPGSSGFSNPDDPAAILRNANPVAPLVSRTATPCPAVPSAPGCSPGTGGVAGGFGVPGSFQLAYQRDTDYTYLPRYTQDLSGNQLANSPHHKVAFNANYTFNLSAGKLILSSSFAWRSEQYSDVFETEEAKVPSWSTVGARIIWTDPDNRYTIMLYGTNLLDDEAPDAANTARIRTGLSTSAATAGPQGAAYYPGYNLSPPREYGLEVQYRFGAK